MTPTLVVKNARIATMQGAQALAGDGPLALASGDLAISGETLVQVGGDCAPPAGCAVIDAAGALVTPGLVEPHTHLVFAGDRGGEHAQRLGGTSYLEIARAGGGILSTVRATRAASEDALVAGARERLGRLARGGVTTVEVKSGYGLSVEHELRLLRAVRAAARGAPCDVEATVLGLHAVPPEQDRAQWVRAVADELFPRAAREGLARHCDAFCEQGAFSAEECRTALSAGARAGLVPHLHADQLTAGGGAELAAELSCASADHLERATAAGAQALARAGTAAVLLPLAAFFLRERAPAQAAPFLAAGATVALGGNLNPGSQRIEGVSLLLAAGCLLSGLTPAQALWACTRGAAQALRLSDRGRLVSGLRADLVLWEAKDADHLPYHAGVDHARVVIRRGEVVVDRRGEPPLACG